MPRFGHDWLEDERDADIDRCNGVVTGAPREPSEWVGLIPKPHHGFFITAGNVLAVILALAGAFYAIVGDSRPCRAPMTTPAADPVRHRRCSLPFYWGHWLQPLQCGRWPGFDWTARPRFGRRLAGPPVRRDGPRHRAGAHLRIDQRLPPAGDCGIPTVDSRDLNLQRHQQSTYAAWRWLTLPRPWW